MIFFSICPCNLILVFSLPSILHKQQGPLLTYFLIFDFLLYLLCLSSSLPTLVNEFRETYLYKINDRYCLRYPHSMLTCLQSHKHNLSLAGLVCFWRLLQTFNSCCARGEWQMHTYAHTHSHVWCWMLAVKSQQKLRGIISNKKRRLFWFDNKNDNNNSESRSRIIINTVRKQMKWNTNNCSNKQSRKSHWAQRNGQSSSPARSIINQKTTTITITKTINTTAA